MALLTAASTLSVNGPSPAADDLVDKCTAVMREYRGTAAAVARAMSEAEERQKRRANNTKNRNNGDQSRCRAGAGEAVSALAHKGGRGAGAGRGGGDNAEAKLDVFVVLRYAARSTARQLDRRLDRPPQRLQKTMESVLPPYAMPPTSSMVHASDYSAGNVTSEAGLQPCPRHTIVCALITEPK